MPRKLRTVRQRAMQTGKRIPFPVVERPFLGDDVAPQDAYARLRAGRCPRCEAYLLFDSKNNPGDYCEQCDHVWTDEEEEKISHDAHWVKLMKTA